MPHHKSGPFVRFQPGLLVKTNYTEKLRPCPLGKFQIVGIINDAAGIGIFVIHSGRKIKPAVFPCACRRRRFCHFNTPFLISLPPYRGSFRHAGGVQSDEERKLLEKYRRLPLSGRQTVHTLVDALDIMVAEEQRLRPRQERRTIPLYQSPAAAGFAAPVFGEDYTLVPVEGDVPPGAELAVRIQGDSMMPQIADGDVVYVNHDPLQNGDVGIFCVDGDMLCKQYYRDGFGMVYLFSLNRARADMDVTFHRDSGRSLTCFGRVMIHSQPLPQQHM